MDNQNQENMQNKPKSDDNYNDLGSIRVQGHIKIFDPETKEIFVDKRNAIHYENFSIALANGIANTRTGFISDMVFGTGGSRIDPTGIILYLTPNTTGLNASLYNQTFSKIVDSQNPNNSDPTRNYMEIRHTNGVPYTDILVSCLLDFGEPSDQAALDSSVDQDGQYVFDEIGLRGYTVNGQGEGPLLTHVIFHPVQKSLNRLVQIDYTVRIQSLTSGT